jgi:hypothetical protein
MDIPRLSDIGYRLLEEASPPATAKEEDDDASRPPLEPSDLMELRWWRHLSATLSTQA